MSLKNIHIGVQINIVSLIALAGFVVIEAIYFNAAADLNLKEF